MKLTHPLESGMKLSAEVGEDCATTAAGLLARLAPFAAGMHEGDTRIAVIDWATLRLHAASGEVIVEEPDFGGNPTQFQPWMVSTSRIFMRQKQMLSLLGITGVPTSADQFVRVAEDALHAVSVVGHREHATEAIISGWQLITANSSNNTRFAQYSVRELAALRPAWCAALALPPQWAFRFAGNTLMDCLSPGGQRHSLLLSIDV